MDEYKYLLATIDGDVDTYAYFGAFDSLGDMLKCIEPDTYKLNTDNYEKNISDGNSEVFVLSYQHIIYFCYKYKVNHSENLYCIIAHDNEDTYFWDFISDPSLSWFKAKLEKWGMSSSELRNIKLIESVKFIDKHGLLHECNVKECFIPNSKHVLKEDSLDMIKKELNALKRKVTKLEKELKTLKGK